MQSERPHRVVYLLTPVKRAIEENSLTLEFELNLRSTNQSNSGGLEVMEWG